MTFKRLVLFFFVGFFALGMGGAALAQAPMESKTVTAKVISIESDTMVDGVRQMQFTARDKDGASYHVDTSTSYTEGVRYDIRDKDKIILVLLPNASGGYDAQLADVVRTHALFWIALLFVLLTIAVGWWRGVAALVGLGVTLVVLFAWLFPHILNGASPLPYTVAASVIILAVNMHLSHGLSRSTRVAFLSTLAGLLLAIGFSAAFVALAKLSGLASEESVFLFWQHAPAINPRGLLLSGIILGAVGVLDDIAIGQSEAVSELRRANPSLVRKELFLAAMRLGRHHIASTVNTLVLAYAGAAVPLLLLFMNAHVNLADFLNTETVAEEIIRTLAGTAALVLTVPIATAFSVFFGTGKRLDRPPHAR